MGIILVKVAKAKNLSTKAIVQILTDQGITILNRPNIPLTEEMVRHVDAWLDAKNEGEGVREEFLN